MFRMKYFPCVFFFFISLVNAVEFGGSNILFINQEKNDIAEKAMDSLLQYLNYNSDRDVKIKSIARVNLKGIDAKTDTDAICEKYDESLKNGYQPHLVLDTTLSGIASDSVKSFTLSAGIPTVSTSYGLQQDLGSWKTINASEAKYLVHIMPPTDVIPEVIPYLIVSQNLTDAAVLFDDSFEMNHKYINLLNSYVKKYRFGLLPDPSSMGAFLQSYYKELGLINFFILGRPETIQNVLNAANEIDNFSDINWFVITPDREKFTCACNATVVSVQPQISEDNKDRLEVLLTTYSLPRDLEINSAFYFDVSYLALSAVTNLYKQEKLQEVKYLPCSTLASHRFNNDIKFQTAMMQVRQEPSYAPILLTFKDNNYMKFNMSIAQITIQNGETVNSLKTTDWGARVYSLGIKNNACKMVGLVPIFYVGVLMAIYYDCIV